MKRTLVLLALLFSAGVAIAAEINDLNITDASNTGRFPENMAPSAVNDGARALEGLLARWHKDNNGSLAANAFDTNIVQITPNRTIGSLYDGLTFAVAVTAANTGAVTFQVGSLSGKTLKKNHDQDLVSGDLEAGEIIVVSYDSEEDVFQLLSPVASGSQLVAANNLSDLTNVTAARSNLGFDGASGVITNGDLDSTVKPLGTQTIWVPAAAWRPTISNGVSSFAEVETTSGRPDIGYLGMDPNSEECAQTNVAFPTGWDEGTITFVPYWSQGGNDSGGVTFTMAGVAIADDGTIDVAYGTTQESTDTAHATTHDLHVGPESSAITIAGTPAAGKLTYLKLCRDVADSSDTLAAWAFWLGAKILYTLEQANDD